MKASKTNKIIPVFLAIVIATVFALLAGLYFSTSQAGNSFQSVVFPSVIILSIFTSVTAGLGLYLGPKLGLGAPRLNSVMQMEPGCWGDLFDDFKLAFPIGLIVGFLLVGLRYVLSDYLPSELPEFGFRGFWGGLLISLSAAIGEEVWFRLGLMTVLVWVTSKVFNYEKHEPTIIWSLLILVSFVFGMAHFPQLISHGAAKPFAVFGTLFGNVVVGIIYGWFYWKRGLLAAIIAHFSVDIAIHAIPALL